MDFNLHDETHDLCDGKNKCLKTIKTFCSFCKPVCESLITQVGGESFMRLSQFSPRVATRTRSEIQASGNEGKTDVEVCLEAQRVRRHYASILHHGSTDGPQVLEELSGLAGAQSLDVDHDPLMRLKGQSRVIYQHKPAQTRTPCFKNQVQGVLCKTEDRRRRSEIISKK